LKKNSYLLLFKALTDFCSLLNEDNIGSDLLAAAARVRIHHSQVASGLALVKAQVDLA